MPEGSEKFRKLKTVNLADTGPVVTEMQPSTPAESVPATATENVQAAEMPIHQSVLTASLQDSDTPKQQERKKAGVKAAAVEVKKRTVTGPDAIERVKSGYAFDPARTKRLKNIAFFMGREQGAEVPLYQLIEEGMDYVIRKYARYDR